MTTLGPRWVEWQSVLSLETIRDVWADSRVLARGLQFSVAALTILGFHELGHYWVCRRRSIPATLPYFIPSPVGIGTLGAFIRIRGRLRNRPELLDMAIAGPVAGFVALLPFLVAGIAWSGYVSVDVDPAGDVVRIVPGGGILFNALFVAMHGPAPAAAVQNLHPFALAAWLGLFATALNLLPLGQLDGGHILYSIFGRWSRAISFPLWCVLAGLSYWWPGWALWAIITLFLGLRHPALQDDGKKPLGRARISAAFLALVLLALSFSPVPLSMLP